jgi:hypothetical protein
MSLRYSDKPWVNNYDKGVPATVELPTHPVQHFLEEGARRIPNNPAMVFRWRISHGNSTGRPTLWLPRWPPTALRRATEP